MIITQTPLRISFFGGGTDYPAWYREHGGAVLSSSINKYSYLHVRRLPPFFPYKTKVVWSRIEDVNQVDEIVHPSVRETLKYVGFEDGISVHYNGDVPAQTGLGSSSSFTVGFLHALYGLLGQQPERKRLAEEAIHIEQNCIRENVGSQDQIAAAIGGLNRIDFATDGSFSVTPLAIGSEKMRQLEGHMMLFFTGITRHASAIAAEQLSNIPKRGNEMKQMRELVDEAVTLLSEQRFDWLDEFGRLLDHSWQIKRSLSSSISTDKIDAHYQAAKQAGALGGKLLGAGGGGFLLIYAHPAEHQRIAAALPGLTQVPFRFESSGSQIIYKMD
jgi:D-glycero-alpha-D-manno-heptose-7-phosphate kinase